ncbi:MAG: glucose-1-phosphate adenylyltransferase, partial [Clostridia bacterium]|nr:glucose-1-phosphate adenylyltransferase [Clostridia bacterium]
KASMGVYVFNWKKLRKYLIEDENNPESDNDFGHNVIPAMKEAGERMFAYQFDGYWKDVGTIDSLWDANLDLLNPKVDLDLDDDSWKIYSKSPVAPPHYVGALAKIENSMIAEGCDINGTIDFSVLFSNVTVEEGAEVKYSIVMPGTVVKKGAKVQYSIVAEDAVIEEGAVVGKSPEDMQDISAWGVTVIGGGVKIGKNAVVDAKLMVDSDIGGAE